ncbi:MAG: carbohydrate ABC transporter permease [Nitrososphaerales archaeon]
MQGENAGLSQSLPAIGRGGRSRASRLLGEMRRHWILYALVTPSLLMAIIFYYYPLLNGLYHSFTYWDVKRTIWVGLENYERIFNDPISLIAWRNMATILVAQLLITITFPLLGAALVVHLRGPRSQYWWRLVFVIPIVVPAPVMVFIWRWVYGPEGGLNLILKMLGLEELTRLWLGRPATALAAIIFTAFPWVAGLSFLVYLAALQSISPELLDAAKVDGASGLRTFWSIELPLVRGQMVVLLILTLIFYLRSFDAPLIMTNGGPGSAGTLVPGLQMYRAVREDLDLGYGSAIGTILLVATLLFTFGQNLIARRASRASRS